MATGSKVVSARGQHGKQADGFEGDSDPDNEDFMTAEDKQLLANIDDDEEESVLDVEADGLDVGESEISSFLQKLGVDKYRPFPASSSTGEKLKQNLKRSASKTDIAEGSVELERASNRSLRNKEKSSINTEQQQSTVQFLEGYRTRKHLLLKPGELWREEEVHPLPPEAPDEKLVNSAEKLAQKLLEDEIALYCKQRENTKRSEARWLKTVLTSGTLSDKMAALTLLVQESPLHNVASLDSLISMAGKKGRREAIMAVDTLRDLFLTGLLPDDRKLRAFNQQPILDLPDMASGNIDSRDKLLVMWHFESLLKKKYAAFIKTLGDLSFDTLQTTKEKALSTIHQLLTGKPEQENTLLPMLVNKLGDPSIKSKATYLLTKLVDEHPNMKPVIVREVQQLLYRPNVSQRAQYYAICYLSQLRLSQAQSDLAAQLIQIYFYFFQTFLKKGEVDNKMMSALLTGVNRAYVYAKAKKEQIAEKLDAVYKIIPTANFHTGVQALMLLYQVSDASTNASDRFYMCLYRKLADPALKNSSKQAIFMNLLFKSMKADVIDRRIKAFVKRVLQVYSQQPPQIICGVLILLSQILKDKPGLLDLKHSSEGVWSDEEEEKFVDLPAPEEFDNEFMAKDDDAVEDVETQDGVKARPENGHSNAVSTNKGSWVHRVNFGGSSRSTEYDPYNRNPMYSRAELDCMWELQQLTKHYHPSVRLYANSLCQGKPIEYSGDPLRDFTLIRFLDRFVYKNPKKDLENKSSIIQKFKKLGPSGVRAIPVNSKEFLEIGEEGVPEDEKFFHRYFMERARRRGDDASDVDSDAGSVGDAEFDAFLDGFEKDADRDDIGDMDLDFAGDKAKTKSKRKDNKQPQESDGESDDFDDDDEDIDLEDEELAAEFQREMEDVGPMDDSDLEDGDYENDINSGPSQSGFKEEDIEPSTDEDDELKMMMLANMPKKRKTKKSEDEDFPGIMAPRKKQKKNKHDTADLFASAEEFAHLLEEDTETGQISLGGTADLRNKDKAAQKQLKWEADRDRWLQDKKGKHSRPNKGKTGGGPSKKSFGKKQRPKGDKWKTPGKHFKQGQKKFKGKGKR